MQYTPPYDASTFGRVLERFAGGGGAFWQQVQQDLRVSGATLSRRALQSGTCARTFELCGHETSSLYLVVAERPLTSETVLRIIARSEPIETLDDIEHRVLDEVQQRTGAVRDANCLVYTTSAYRPPFVPADFGPLFHFEHLLIKYSSWQQTHRFHLGHRARVIVDGFEAQT